MDEEIDDDSHVQKEKIIAEDEVLPSTSTSVDISSSITNELIQEKLVQQLPTVVADLSSTMNVDEEIILFESANVQISYEEDELMDISSNTSGTNLSNLHDLSTDTQTMHASDIKVRKIRKTEKKKRKTVLKQNSKKKIKHEKDWIDSAAKSARSMGEAGIGRKGPIEAKQVKEGCSKSCRFNCAEKISEDERQAAFSDYYNLADKTKQWECISNWVSYKQTEHDQEAVEVAEIRGKQLRIKYLYQYTLPSSAGPVPVCRTMFLDTLDISQQTVRTAIDKKIKSNSTNVIMSDLRGKHKNRPYEYPEHLLNEVRDHILKFPVIESHYCRENTQRKFLEEGLSISRMYRMYVDEMRNKKKIANENIKGKEEHEKKNYEEKEKLDEKDESEEVDSSETDNELEETSNEQEKKKDEINNDENDEKKKNKNSDETKDKKKTYKKSWDIVEENIVRFSKYSEIFNKEFNYGFFQPKKDRCESCEAYKIMPQEEKLKNEAKHAHHSKMKSEVRKLMKNDKQIALVDSSVCCANYDMQKILTTPKLDVSILYYMCKLCVWNFTIFELGIAKGHSFLWNETVGNRGSNEIASYVQSFIYEKAKTGVDKFRFYTDNCSGQNRNRNIISMYLKVSNELNIEIIHRFLEVGHTQSDGDSMHARIENYTKVKSIYTQDHWAECISECKEDDPKYEVKQVQQHEIFNFDFLAEQFNWKPVKIASVREIRVVPGQSDIEIKYDFLEDAKHIKILKKNKKLENILSHKLPLAYDQPLPLKEKKLKDLNTMLTRNLIPQEFVNGFKKVLES